MKELVSVIVPIYKVEAYISVCLESILKQTHKNMQIILVHKDSEDSSLKICKYYAKKDERIKLIEVDKGDKRNLKNIGLESARAKYVTFVDGGDTVRPNYISYMLEAIVKEKADLVCTSFYNKNEKPKEVKAYEIIDNDSIMPSYMHMKFKSHFYAKMYKKSLFEDISYPEVNYYDYFIVGYKLFEKADKVVNSYIENYCLNVDKKMFKDRITDYDRMKKISSCFDMLTFIEENYPRLTNFCKTKICFEALDLFKDVKDKDYRKQLFSYVKLYRKYALHDERIDMSKKMLCMRSMLGYHFMSLTYNTEELLRKPI